MSRSKDERPRALDRPRYRNLSMAAETHLLLKALAHEDASTMSAVLTRLVRGAAKAHFGAIDVALERAGEVVNG